MRSSPSWRYALYLACFAFWCVAGLVLFSRGFFLSRRTLPDTSDCRPFREISCEELTNSTFCSDDDKISAIIKSTEAPLVCGLEPVRIILIVVDAFRYDFAEYDEKNEKPLAFQNKLPIIKQLLRNPETTRLFRFVADPPTTTLQRLKGLTTGSLPTFIDAGDNFATAQIMEDNLIDQALKRGGKAVLLGDDTWLKLFPGRWTRTHAQYSFHTWDLDTVDNEVDSRIYKELAESDWSLLVAHYLGVDHAGHRYGPYHSEMARKLRELDQRLDKVVREMPRDAVLCVIGDHGMTETGDHGGESTQEVTATLLIHSPSGLAWQSSPGLTVRQTDLAATLSVAAGGAPPAPSLGLMQLAALPARYEDNWRQSLLSVVSNLDQVVRYTRRYGSQSLQVDTVRLHEVVLPYDELRKKAALVTNERDFHKYYDEVRSFVDGVRELCRTLWVEFDSLGMMRGCLILVMAVFLNYLLLEGIPTTSIAPIFRSPFVPFTYSSLFASISLSFLLYYFEATDDLEHTVLLSCGLTATAVLSVLVVQHWDGIAERWYLAKDACTHERLSRAALVASAMLLTSNSFTIEEGTVSSYLCLSVLALLVISAKAPRTLVALWTAVALCLLATRPYRACREEQGDCWAAGAGAESPGAGGRARGAAVLSMAALGSTVALARPWLSGGPLWRYVPAASAACAGGSWAAAWGGPAARPPLLARLAWAGLGALALQPGAAGARPALVRAALIVHIACSLTLGPAAAAPAALLLVAGALTLTLVAEARKHLSVKLGGVRIETTSAVAWTMLSTYYLYGTGHHATLAHIRWSAAFHAGHLATEYWVLRCVAGGFVALNTFGGHLLFGVASPLLALWPARGEPDPRPPLSAVFSVCLKFQLCYAVRLLGCMMAATIHCRHLMVWSVFAPKLLYEAGAAVAALVGTTVGFALVAANKMPEPRTHMS